MIATEDSFATICQLLRGWCGVTLLPSKTYLVRNRLRMLMDELETSDLAELIDRAQSTAGAHIRDRIVDALTTHETLFFRDRLPFEALVKHIAPEIRSRTKTGRPKMRIWSAACSTGQEPYSIAMALMESVPTLNQFDLQILATDVSPESIAKAKMGSFPEHEMNRGTTTQQRQRFFHKTGDLWQINDDVKRFIRFEVGNLLGGSQPNGNFDVIFCRNVVIYFSGDDPERTFKMLAGKLGTDGRLFVGCSEMLGSMSHFLRRELVGSATCYRATTN